MRRVKGQQGLNDAFRDINAIDSGVLTNDWYNSIQVQQICIPFQYLFLSLSCNYLNNPRARNIFASSFYLFDLQGILFDESCSDLGCQQVFFKYFFLCLLLLILSFANFFFLAFSSSTIFISVKQWKCLKIETLSEMGELNTWTQL